MKRFSVLALLIIASLAFQPHAFAQDTEPADVTPSDPVPIDEPTLAEVLQRLVDSTVEHDRGAAAVAQAEAEALNTETEAQATIDAANASMAAARQHVVDVQETRAASSASIVGNARAVIAAAEALIAEHSPGQ